MSAMFSPSVCFPFTCREEKRPGAVCGPLASSGLTALGPARPPFLFPEGLDGALTPLHSMSHEFV